MEEKKENTNKQIGVRDHEDQPITLPGVRRFHFFTDVNDRALTKSLNRVAMFGIAATLAVDVGKAVVNKNPQTIYCYECRACYGTQDKCPVGISYQAELVVSARVSDYDRFLRNGGLKCIRCGSCQSFCVQYLHLPQIFGTMQLQTMEAMRKGKIPKRMLQNAFEKGLINRDFIDEVAEFLEQE